MNANFYSMPNWKPFDDNLMRDVVLRAPTPQSRIGEFYQKTFVPDLDTPTEIPSPFNASKPSSKTNQLSSASTRTVDMMQLLETSTGGSCGVDNMLKFTAAAEALIRQRRRIKQRKYRQQQREYTEKLADDVRKIQDEIKGLEQQLQCTSIGISKSQTLWGAATDYFRLFRHGFRSPTDVEYACALNVLKSSMAPNVRDDLVCGPKAVLSRWMMFSLCFDDIFVELQCLEKGPIDNSIVARVNTSITISTDSLRLLFPHLRQEDEVDRSTGRTVNSLATKILGHRLVIRGSVTFEWDDTIGLISSLQSQSDMLTPFLRVLGNLEDVSRVFEGSLVTPECIWPQILE